MMTEQNFTESQEAMSNLKMCFTVFETKEKLALEYNDAQQFEQNTKQNYEKFKQQLLYVENQKQESLKNTFGDKIGSFLMAFLITGLVLMLIIALLGSLMPRLLESDFLGMVFFGGWIYLTFLLMKKVKLRKNRKSTADALNKTNLLESKIIKLEENTQNIFDTSKYTRNLFNDFLQSAAYTLATDYIKKTEYQNTQAISILYYYLYTGEADNLKEALLEFKRDTQHTQAMSKLSEMTQVIKNGFDEMVRATTDIQTQLKTVNKELTNTNKNLMLVQGQVATTNTKLNEIKAVNQGIKHELRTL